MTAWPTSSTLTSNCARIEVIEEVTPGRSEPAILIRMISRTRSPALVFGIALLLAPRGHRRGRGYCNGADTMHNGADYAGAASHVGRFVNRGASGIGAWMAGTDCRGNSRMVSVPAADRPSGRLSRRRTVHRRCGRARIVPLTALRILAREFSGHKNHNAQSLVPPAAGVENRAADGTAQLHQRPHHCRRHAIQPGPVAARPHRRAWRRTGLAPGRQRGAAAGAG